MRFTTLSAAYHELLREANQLAGKPGDFARRAAVYRQIFRASGGNHAFPLIAAHGALWGAGQFRFGARLGRIVAWQYAWSAPRRAEQLAALTEFFDALRDINRQVCIDTYVQFQLTRRFAHQDEIGVFVPHGLLGPLGRLHAARRRGRPLSESERRALFEAHFLHEQQTVVGETLERAAAALDWPLAKCLALRPSVRFAYLPAGTCIPFRNFADREERIRNGMRAFDIAARVGWRRVERSLGDYGLLDPAALADPDGYFARLLRDARWTVRGSSSEAAAVVG
ncbi:MAG TPA: hypothetical protein VMF30_01345 [Pirellulales bacterium]|nr:hypothetical protein [Pirellulales bacterium]